MRADLHAHTTASDGVLDPAALVSKARAAGLDVIAVTDHDTVAGVAAAREAAERAGVRVVPGIELSTKWAGRTLHLLGLFIDPASAALPGLLGMLRSDRAARAQEMVERLNALGYPVTLDDVLSQAGDAIVARPHVARALVARGLVRSVADAFTPELIADGGRADVVRPLLPTPEGVALLRRAGGVPVLAHPAGRPGVLSDDVIAELAAAGLQGLEVDHPEHGGSTRVRLRALADGLGLVPTGGSDFHGPDHGGALGECVTPDEAFARLESLANS